MGNLPQYTDPDTGVVMVEIDGQLREVAELVLAAFKGPRPAGMVPRHINGDLADNRAVNLEWALPEGGSS